jgi:regulator of replication initiation timing
MDIPAPPIPAITPWWPLIAFVLGAVVPTLWAAWLTSRTKRFEADAKRAADNIERDAQQAIEKHKLEVERSRMEYELRKDFQNDLVEECQKLRAECEKLRDANNKMIGTVMEKDLLIKVLTEENHTLKIELAAMKRRIDDLESHIKSLEQTREATRDHLNNNS